MGRKRVETTDRRYVKVGEDEWWDTSSVEIVRERAVLGYMEANGVGIVIIELPEEEPPPTVH